MAYFGVRGSDVVVDVAVFRGIVDLMLDYPDLGRDAARILTQEREVGVLSVDLVHPPMGEQLEHALAWACDKARAGERSARSGEDVAGPDRLVEGGNAIGALFTGN